MNLTSFPTNTTVRLTGKVQSQLSYSWTQILSPDSHYQEKTGNKVVAAGTVSLAGAWVQILKYTYSKIQQLSQPMEEKGVTPCSGEGALCLAKGRPAGKNSLVWNSKSRSQFELTGFHMKTHLNLHVIYQCTVPIPDSFCPTPDPPPRGGHFFSSSVSSFYYMCVFKNFYIQMYTQWVSLYITYEVFTPIGVGSIWHHV